MAAPTAGHVPEAKKDEPKKTDAGHAAPSAARESWISKVPEAVVGGSWKAIKGITGFFGRRIKGVLSGGWEATGGQVTGELSEAGKRMGYESKETGPLNAIAGVIESVGGKVGRVVGGIVDFTIGAPARAAGRILRGAQNVVTGVVLGKTYGKGVAAERHGEEAAASSAGAHPA